LTIPFGRERLPTVAFIVATVLAGSCLCEGSPDDGIERFGDPAWPSAAPGTM
jgi:hypothetical protein